MKSENNIEQFHQLINVSLNDSVFIKLIISKKRQKKQELRSVNIKPVLIKKGLMLSFVYRYSTKDITKNYEYSEAKNIIKDLLEDTFFQGELFTKNEHWHLFINKKKNSSLNCKTLKQNHSVDLEHNKQKNRLISIENSAYLTQLGILNNAGQIKPSMQDKFRQINKYVEIIDGILKSAKPKSPFRIIDMGAGKGYLTFALYDYLQNILKLDSKVLGVEFRQELVEKCNGIAKESGFKNLSFVQGTIEDVDMGEQDMLIALHACDTATDEAIYKGIKSNAKIIICAPCCHKQVRKQLNPENELNLISQYGILKERQAEIITDTIRSQILEAFGYKTKVFEFISTEHTPKNVMIVGVCKTAKAQLDKEILERVDAIKAMHGIEYHHLEKLLNL